ncbi:MAG TPA: chemotaxis protein CheV [Nevskiaceae bacterium]|nr:chemotaxis protein CheV [Nevskiaceae bacterium]
MDSGLLQSIDRQTQLAGHNRLALLLFRLGGAACYGVNVFKVQEVIACPRLHAVPESHPLVRGLALVRGRTIPVIDLATAIGESAIAIGGAHVIVTEFNRSVQGFLVGSVDRIANVSVEDVKPPPGDGEGTHLTAVTMAAGQFVQIIDVEQVLAAITGGPRELSGDSRRRAKLQGRPARVLVADDSRVARNQVSRLLQEIGVEPVQVTDGRQALKYLQSIADAGDSVASQIGMVISDIEMPDMDGYTLTAEIRRDPRLRDLYVLLHTSLSGRFNHAMVDKVGANRFLPKFSPDELADAVLQHLESPP